jgi:hypothetical protein
MTQVFYSGGTRLRHYATSIVRYPMRSLDFSIDHVLRQDSVVGISTDYGLDTEGSEFESW